MSNERRYAAFDLEIAAVIPDDAEDWTPYRPLGITCASVIIETSEGPGRILFSADAERGQLRMTREHAQLVVRTLKHLAGQGYTLLSWNGASFDLDVLAEESGLHEDCARIARTHVDPMFQVVCAKGWPVSLAKVAEGMKLPGKTEGMSGGQAPVLWQAGEFAKVRAYCEQDVRCMLDIVHACEAAGQLRWITKKGALRSLLLPAAGFLSVAHCLAFPEPDISWMDKPKHRAEYLAWTQRVPATTEVAS